MMSVSSFVVIYPDEGAIPMPTDQTPTFTEHDNGYSMTGSPLEIIRHQAARVRELEAQLPDGMKHCTIVFKECEKGHGWLTATNWVQHGCPTCERDRLAAELTALRAACKTAAEMPGKDWLQAQLVLCNALPAPAPEGSTDVLH